METLFLLVPMSLILVVFVVAALWWPCIPVSMTISIALERPFFLTTTSHRIAESAICFVRGVAVLLPGQQCSQTVLVGCADID